MTVLAEMERLDHDQVVFCHDPRVKLKAIVAIHDTTLGPALGGCRMWPYETEEQALTDVLRLSRGMTYKAAVTGLDLGGGKSVILGDRSLKSPAFFRRFGEFVETLGGRYITAEDIGTRVEDMDEVAKSTRHVAGTGKAQGGSGNPSPVTALGTFEGLRASVKHALGKEDVAGLTVGIQGVGSVGMELARLLHEAGGKLVVTDVREEACKRAADDFGARGVGADGIYDAEIDVFAPCAFGAILNEKTIPRLKCKVVAGAANNQLAKDEDGRRLADRGILYAPDYAINAGGLINVAIGPTGYDAGKALDRARKIYDTLLEIYAIADRDGILPFQAADRLAERRLAAARAKRAGA